MKIFALIIVVLAGLNSELLASSNRWPRVFSVDGRTVTMYEPDVVALRGMELEGTNAFSVKKGDGAPTFGALSFKAVFAATPGTDSLSLKSYSITGIRVPDVDSTVRNQVARKIEAEVAKWGLKATKAQLESAAKQPSGIASMDLKTEPPQVLVRYKPAMLISIDGEPKLEAIEGQDVQYVVNSPIPILADKATNKYYFPNGTDWYAATDVKGPWSMVGDPPSNIKLLVKVDEDSKENAKPTKSNLEIVVVTKPPELISFEGQPEWEPLSKNELLYAKNTESDVFMEISGQMYYVLLSGRWFSAKAIDGPWSFKKADQLPTAFSQIDTASVKGEVLAFVGGTQQAKDAVLDANIPTVSAIDKSKASLEVTYKGEPWFENVSGTSMKYAVNASTTVIQYQGAYYACDKGIWFYSAKSEGPWAVAEKRPDDVDNIAASSPIYNVKYVYVYSSTPSVVYVGYTPGYYGTYVYGPTIVYGTGWYYNPWYGPHYYPPPYTYGFHMHYAPYYGWGFGYSYGMGWAHVSFHVHGGWYRPMYHGCFGPAYYRPPYYHHPPHGYHGGGGYGNRVPYSRAPNAYNRPTNTNRAAASPRVSNSAMTRPTPTARPSTPAYTPSLTPRTTQVPQQRMNQPSQNRSMSRPASRPSMGGRRR